MSSRQHALVIGGGAFGTSIANVLANNFKKVILKVRRESVRDKILKQGENQEYLPGHTLAPNLVPALSWEEVEKNVKGSLDLIVSGLPVASLTDFYTTNQSYLTGYFIQKTPLVSLSKGINLGKMGIEFPDDIFFKLWPRHRHLFTFLSGPSFAGEIMQRQITLVTLAGESPKQVARVSSMFETGYFKVLGSGDIKGVLLGGALKNVIAIAGGIIEGLGYSTNTRAAMITRGISEMLKFAPVFEAKAETFYGLSGMGDLILTTTGGLSRNKRFGLELAVGGGDPFDVQMKQKGVVEGYHTAQAVNVISGEHDIKTHIFDGVHRVVFKDENPRNVIEELMALPFGFEGK